MAITQDDILRLFPVAGAVKNSDTILLMKANSDGTMTAAKVTAQVLRAYLAAGFAVTIGEDGYYYIGGVNTGISVSGGGGDVQPIVIDGDVNNAPDEEDLTSVNIGGTDVIRFKDKAFAPLSYSGMGRVYVRKNVKEIGGVTKNWLEQSMLTQTNTVYIVQYNYSVSTANDNTIEIPANSILLFAGGSINGGTLSCDNTRLCSSLDYGYLNDITLTGTHTNDTIGGINDVIAAEALRAQAADADLQAQIDAIVSGAATVSLTAKSQQTNSSVIFAGEQNLIKLRAESGTAATAISISGGSMAQPATGSGTVLTATDTLTMMQPGTESYAATFVISGRARTASASVTAVHPIYYGAGMSQGDVLDVAARRASARTTPKGTYDITVSGTSKYIFFFVPANMTTQITSAKMNGFEFPLQALSDVTAGNGLTYKAYRSSNTNEAGSYSITINP